MNANQKPFLRMLKTYIIIVMVLVMMMVPLCIQMINITRQRELKDAQSTMQNGLDLLSSQLQSIQSILTSSRVNDPLLRVSILKGARRASDYYALLKAQQYVAAVASSNSYVVDLLLYFNQSDILLTKKSSFDSMDSFLAYYDIPDLDNFLSSPASPSNKLYFYPETTLNYIAPSSSSLTQPTPVLVYRLPLALSMYPSGKGVAYVLIDKKMVMDTVLPDNFRTHGALALTDTQNQLVAGFGDAGQVQRLLSLAPGQQDRAHAIVRAGDNDMLRITASIPQRIFTHSISSIFWTIMLYVVGILAAGVLASIVAAYRQSLPLNKLLSDLQAQGFSRQNNRNEYEFISASFSRMASEKSNVLAELNSYKATLRSNMIDRLLNTSTLSHRRRQQVLDTLTDFPLHYLVGYGAFTAPQGPKDRDLSVLSALSLNHLQRVFPPSVIVHRIDEMAFALILPIAGDMSKAVLHDIVQQANRELPLSLTLSLSSAAQGIDEVNTAFEQARLGYILGDKHQPLILPDYAQSSGTASYDIQDCMALYRSLAAGDELAAQEYIQKLLDVAHMPQADLEQVYYLVRMTMLFAARDCIGAQRPVPEIPKYKSLQNPDALLKILYAKNTEICQAVNDRKRSNNQALKNEILSYVLDNYTDDSVYGKKLAERFHVSEKYLYNFFKEQTGFSLGDYLLHLRLNRASELLRSTQDSVGYICTQSGFTSQNTFYKAFRRTYGISPSEYRERQTAQSPKVCGTS